MTENSKLVAGAVVQRLIIERFRGIKSLTWYPKPNLNLILGGGDVGKSTILEAVALLLSPTNTTVLTDSDYFQRNVDGGFLIEAVMSLPAGTGIHQQTKMSWPWEWDGKQPVQPGHDENSEAPPPREMVYRLRVQGTSELDLNYEIFQPNGSVDNLNVGLRRAIGLVRLGGDDRNDRDLRLVQGSALDRLLADKGVRARLGQQLAAENISSHLSQDAKEKLATLDTTFEVRALPSELGLGLTGGQGFSLGALVGLTSTKDEVALPMASWGAGTRRLAALAIAASLQGGRPITVVDEVERGLEPYRQRSLINELAHSGSQVFLTTHSAAAISAAKDASLWYVDSLSRIGALDRAKVGRHQETDPETLLARLTIAAEGKTEMGFSKFLLDRAIKVPLLDHGVCLTYGAGNDAVLTLLEGLAEGGLRFGGFVDNEGRNPGRWAAVKKKLGPLMFQWKIGCAEDNVIPTIDVDMLEEFIRDPDGDKTGMRLRTLADRLGIQEKDFTSISAKAQCDLVTLIMEAALGKVPDGADDATKKQFKGHASCWFKSVEGGHELADKALRLGGRKKLEEQLLPFVNAVCQAIHLPTVTAL